MNTRHLPSAPRRFGVGAVALALGIGLATPLVTAPAQAASSQSIQPRSVASEVKLTQEALTRAVAQVKAGHLGTAGNSLNAVRIHSIAANLAAYRLIGAPPTDPESDDPPGPPAVTKVLSMDNQVGTKAAALFNGHSATAFVTTLRRTVSAIQTRRDVVVDKVAGLPAEGARADYADGLADTLPMYTREVTFFTTALRTYRLSATARTALGADLARARATKATMQRAFGGGERPLPGGR